MAEERLDRLRAALDPKSIAIVGASDNPDKVGGRPLQFLRRFGYRGSIHPVNPGRSEVQGMRSIPRLAELAQSPEVVIVAVAGEAAVEAVEQAAAVGAKVAIVMSAGFGESDPLHGRNAEARMAAVGAASGMRVIGPNSQGLANFGTGAIASFSTMFSELPPPEDGSVGIVGQSGAVSAALYGLLRQKGLGVRHVHATGNECDVTTSELASVVAEDPDLRLLLMYLEGFLDPHNLVRAASIARERGLPIVVVKGGRTEAGQAAARTHTGALASEDRVVDAFFRKHGIRRARSLREVVESAELYLKGWRPSGRRIVAVTTSGATGVMVADAASGEGLEMARFGPALTRSLGEALPGIATAANPIDLTGALLTDSTLLGRVLDVVAKDPQVDAFLLGITVAGAGYDVGMLTGAAARCAADTGKPVVIAAPQPGVREPFRAVGLPVYPFETQAVEALGNFIAHLELLRSTPPPPVDAGAAARAQPDAAKRMLNEADSLAVLSAAGIAVAPNRLCTTLDEAIDAFETLGGVVAMKGCSSEVAHKSELGVVELGIDSAQGAVDAYRRISAKLEGQTEAWEGILVSRMIRGRRELVLGAHRDPVFGPILMVGDGGRYLEAMPDVRVLIAPVRREDVREALASLRIAPLFGGVRGEAPMDVESVVDAAMAVSDLMMRDDPRIDSIDVNPLIVGSRGEGCTAVDAVVVTLVSVA